ncbi:MAG: hypothetical protein DI535_00665 [Citrobacter freundii]|nr:MAG: hypothetical protein DI535_00665 [Citrobacter freundii]
MAKVYPIIFSYFSKYPKKVQKDYRKFFHSIYSSLDIGISLSDIYTNEFVTPALLDLAIAVDQESVDEQMQQYAESLSQKLFTKFSKYNVIENIAGSKEYRFTQESPYIVIYFQSSAAIPPKSLVNLYQFVRKLLTNTSDGIGLEKKVVIVLPTSLPSKNEFTFVENIKEECDRNQVILLDKYGSAINEGIDLEDIFVAHKQELKEDPLKLLEAKLIGRVGHFQRTVVEETKTSRSCHLYFYDGSKCIEEVAELIKQKANGHYNHIIYHCPESPWMESAILNLKLDQELNIEVYNILSEEDKKRLETIAKSSSVLFVLDLIHTGKTITEQLKKEQHLLSSLKLTFVSVLYSGQIDDQHSKSATIQGIDFEFFLGVRQLTFQQGACEMCQKFKIPIHQSTVGEPHMKLQSYFYWKLTDTYGYLVDAEKDTPSYRRPFPLTPNFAELLKNCGPYIASKIINYFDVSPHLSSAQSYTFICPEEEAANLIGRSLEYLADISVIAIPGTIIKSISEKKFNKEEIVSKYQSEEWLKALLHFQNNSPNKSVVILDEFAQTGTKLKDLASLANEFSLMVAAYFPFVLYNENLSLPISDKIHSLYSFNLFLSKPLQN